MGIRMFKILSNYERIVLLVELVIIKSIANISLNPNFYFFFPVTQLSVSSYRAITYYQSSGRMKHKMQGMLFPQHTWKDTHTNSNRCIFTYTVLRTSSLPFLFFIFLPQATGCTVKVRPLDSHPSLPSSLHPTTWMFTTTKVSKPIFLFTVSHLICIYVICFCLHLYHIYFYNIMARVVLSYIPLSFLC